MEQLDRHSLLKAFNNKEDKILFAKIIDAAENSLKWCVPVFTDFLDPFKAETIYKLLNNAAKGFEVKLYGGILTAERKMFGFCGNSGNKNLGNKSELDDDKFPIMRIKLSYEKKFAKKLTHRDFLGSVMGLIADRGKIGDIILQEGYAYILVKNETKNETSKIILKNLISVGKTPVSCEIVDFMEINSIVAEPKLKTTTVASPRIDGMISHCFHVSRSESSDAISSGKIFVNWIQILNRNTEISEGDIITFRGIGRIEIKSIRNSRKGKCYVEYLHFL